VKNRKILRKIETVQQAHFAKVEVADGTKIVGEKARCQDGFGVVSDRKVASPGNIVELVILEVSFVSRAVGDQEQRSRGKQQGRSGPLGHQDLF
jgi:hypothetical protein